MQLDNTPIPIRELEERYSISDQTLTKRFNYLRIKPFKIEGDKRKSYIHQHQVDILDALHEHIKNGGVMAEFKQGLDELDNEIPEYQTEKVGISIDTPIGDIIVPQNQDILLTIANRPHPDEMLRRLEEHSVNGWWRTKEELLDILDLPKLPRRAYGFKFKSVAKGWYKVEKVD